MIEIKNISATYTKGKKALDNISFRIQEGTFNSLVGPSGCGKTTMLKVLAGFMDPSAGQILMDGKDITQMPVQKRETPMVFQNYALWPHMSIFDNVAYGLKLRKLPAAEIEKRVYAMMDIVELDPSTIKNRYPSELSGGQQQRVALSRALVTKPNIILMDEPLSNLDAKVRQRLRIQIREIQKQLGVTAIYVTHDQEEALSMSDQVIVMNNGIVAQAGSPYEVYTKPATQFVAEFLGNSNMVPCRIQSGSVIVQSQKTGIVTALKDCNANMVVRAENIFFEKPEESDCLVFDVDIVENMYAGTYYKLVARMEKIKLCITADKPNNRKGKIKIYIPRNKVFIFAA